MEIKRTHHLDLDFVADDDKQVLEFATELATGRLVTLEVIVPLIGGDALAGEDRATVRFSGPKFELEQVLDRFITHPDFDGDEAIHLVDSRMAETLAGN